MATHRRLIGPNRRPNSRLHCVGFLGCKTTPVAAKFGCPMTFGESWRNNRCTCRTGPARCFWYYDSRRYAAELQYYLRKRPAKDIWENLYEFLLVENAASVTVEELFLSKSLKEILGTGKAGIIAISDVYKQQLTHQTICGQFIHVKLNKPLKTAGFEAVDKKEMEYLPFPKFINHYLQDKTVSLNLF